MLGSMTVAARGTLALLAPLLAAVLAGCGTDSAPSPPTGIDELVIPTPSPDPADFVAGVDNPWFPLPPSRTWTYDVVDTTGTHRLRVRVAAGPTVAGVATTARISAERGRRVVDWYAEDTAGNVWWFGRAGSWRAGSAGAEAGLAMPAAPRVGDGYRTAYAAGVVEERDTVEALDGSATVPAGSYQDLLVVRADSPVPLPSSAQRSYARGVGLVEEDGLTGSRLLRLRATA
jgi:hypothetical protein